jgi:hypothetical protein
MALMPMLEGRAAMFAGVWSGVKRRERFVLAKEGTFTPPV